MKKTPIGIIMATMLEAKPFVDGLGLEQIAEKPFPLFSRDNLRLLICGIGKANAAMGTTHMILTCTPALICNPGAAGATDTAYALGECRHINKILEPDRPDFATGLPYVHEPATLPGLPLSVLATQDKPIHTEAQRAALSADSCLVDMEGASIAQVCKRYGLPCYLFKFISDLPNHTTSHDIRANIEAYREPFFSYFNANVLPAINVIICDPHH